MTETFEDFLNKLKSFQELSELEVEIIDSCKPSLEWYWHRINETHAFAKLRLVAKEVPRNIQLKTGE